MEILTGRSREGEARRAPDQAVRSDHHLPMSSQTIPLRISAVTALETVYSHESG